jgi:hypothetical protein
MPQRKRQCKDLTREQDKLMDVAKNGGDGPSEPVYRTRSNARNLAATESPLEEVITTFGLLYNNTVDSQLWKVEDIEETKGFKTTPCFGKTLQHQHPRSNIQ